MTWLPVCTVFDLLFISRIRIWTTVPNHQRWAALLCDTWCNYESKAKVLIRR